MVCVNFRKFTFSKFIKIIKTRESRSPATAKLSPGMGIGRDAD